MKRILATNEVYLCYTTSRNNENENFVHIQPTVAKENTRTVKYTYHSEPLLNWFPHYVPCCKKQSTKRAYGNFKSETSRGLF
jgi:hypothetical protein